MDYPVLVGYVYVAFAAVPASIAVIPWRNRDSPGGTPLTIAVVGAAGTAVCHGLTLLLMGPGTVSAEFLFALSLAAATLGTFYLAAEYTGRAWLERPSLVVPLASLSVSAALGAAVVRVGADVPAPMALTTANNVITTLVSVAALTMFAGRFLDARGVYRKQSGALFVGFGIATALGVLQVALAPQVFDLIPIGVTVGSGVIAWALFRYEVLETVPVARGRLFDQLGDPVVALDDGRVVDYNDAATALFGVDDAVLGEPLSTVFAEAPTLAARHGAVLDDGVVGAVVEGDQRHFDRDHPTVGALLAGDQPTESTLAVDADGTQQYFDVTVSPFGTGPQSTGRLVVFRNVTEQQRREEELDLLKEVLSRVLRHNLRNDVTAIKGYARLVREHTEGEPAALAEKIVETSDDLVETSRKARRIEDVIEAEETQVIGLAAAIEEAVTAVAKEYPDADYEVSVPADLAVQANPLLGTALVDLIENGVVHSDADRPRIAVEGSRDDRWVEVTVSDNGPGIPEAELTALQQGGETDLVHSSGAGLWLVYTVVEESGGRISYEIDDGTTVRLFLRMPA
jgi:signal transduction histidine kinase